MTTLSITERNIIAAVTRSPGITAREVAGQVYITPQYAIDMLLKLTREGMLSRERDGHAFRYYRRAEP